MYARCCPALVPHTSSQVCPKLACTSLQNHCRPTKHTGLPEPPITPKTSTIGTKRESCGGKWKCGPAIEGTLCDKYPMCKTPPTLTVTPVRQPRRHHCQWSTCTVLLLCCSSESQSQTFKVTQSSHYGPFFQPEPDVMVTACHNLLRAYPQFHDAASSQSPQPWQSLMADPAGRSYGMCYC
jgi:hypothetical protein